MTGSVFTVFTYIFAVAALVMLFVPRLPAVAAAFLALLFAHYSGAFVSGNVMVFWGAVTLAALFLRMLQRKDVCSPKGNAYIALAAVTGAFVGYAIAPMSSTLILGSAIAAFLGAVAYMRTPASPRYPVASGRFVQFLCARGLQAVVTVVMSAIAVASVLS